MELNEFVKAFAAEFDETPIEAFAPETRFRELEEWGSLTSLSIISIVDDIFDKTLTGEDLRNSNTIEELYNVILNK